MDKNFSQLLDQYTIAIQSYLTVCDPQMRQVADEIGSYALANGLGITEIITIHQQALARISPTFESPQNFTQILKATTEFLAQTLLAFETKKIIQEEPLFNNINNKSKQNNHDEQIFLSQEDRNLATVQQSLIVDAKDDNDNYTKINQVNKQLLYEWDTETNTITWEDDTEKILGYSVAEMPRKIEELIELIHCSQQDAAIEIIKQALAQKTPILLQYSLRCQNGSYIFIEHKGQFFRNSQGNLCKLVGLLEDISDSKQVEAKIHFQSRLLDSVQQAVVATDLQGKIIYWNHFAEVMFGWSVAEVLDCRINEIISTLTTIKVSEIIDRIANGESWSGELMVQQRDGQFLPIMEIDSPIYNQHGSLIGISSIMVDLTERKRIELALRQSEERFQVAIKNSPITVFHQDTNLRYTWISNPAAEFNNQTIVGKQDTDLFPPAEAQNLIAIKQQVLELKTGYRQEISVTINGAIKYYDLNLEPLRNETGEIIGITGACYDITKRKQAISALQKADRHLRLHVENSPLAAIEWNQEAQVKRWSGQAEKIFGWRAEEVMGKKITELGLIRQEDMTEVGQGVKSLLEAKVPHNLCRKWNYTKNGKSVFCQWYNSAVVDESGKVVSILSLTEDITAQKQAETERDILLQKLEQQNQNLEDKVTSRTAQLAAELVQRQRAEAILKNLVEGTAAFTGKDFFPVLVQHLASALGVAHAIISELRDRQLHILAWWSNNQLQPNTSYDISGTPYEITIAQGIYHCQYRVRQDFPKDLTLLAMEAESYLGVALVDRAGQPIGTLSILHNTPLIDVLSLEEILKVFAARAVAELEQQRVIEALHKSEKRYRTLIKNFPDGAVMLFDFNLRYLCADGAGLADMKLSRESLENHTIWQSWSPDICEILAPKYQNALTGIAETFELPLNERFYLIETLPVKNDNGEIFAGMAIIQDITERKKSQEALKLSQFCLDRVSDRIGLTDMEGNILYANNAACEAFGYSQKELLKMNVQDIDPNYPKDQWLKHWQQLKQQGTQRIESVHRGRDGREFPVEITVTYLLYQGKEYNCSIARDITERKQIEAALRDSEIRVQNLAASIPGMLYQYSVDSSEAFVFVSAGSWEIFELEPNSILQNPQLLWQMIDRQDLESLQIFRTRSATNHQQWRWQWQIVTPSGQHKLIQNFARARLQPNGDILWDGILIDISDNG